MSLYNARVDMRQSALGTSRYSSRWEHETLYPRPVMNLSGLVAGVAVTLLLFATAALLIVAYSPRHSSTASVAAHPATSADEDGAVAERSAR